MVETRFQTSFIPNRPLPTGNLVYRKDTGGGMGLLSIIATILFAVATLLSLGLFLYSIFLERSIKTKEEELMVVYESLDKTALDTFTNIGRKTASAQDILSRYIAFSRVTDFFESVTLQNVRYRNFSFDALPGGNAKISLKGEAQSYAAVASQAHTFSTHDAIASVSFGPLSLDEKGNVSFDSTIMLKPATYTYKAPADKVSFIPLTE